MRTNMHTVPTLGKKIVKLYDEPIEVSPSPEAVKATEDLAEVAGVSDSSPEPEVVMTPDRERAERRKSFKAAADIEARARQMEKAAKENGFCVEA